MLKKAVFYVNKETKAWRRNSLWMFTVGWQRGQKKFAIMVTVKFYFKF